MNPGGKPKSKNNSVLVSCLMVQFFDKYASLRMILSESMNMMFAKSQIKRS